MNKYRKNYSREREWKHGLLFFVAGFLLFETLSGLSIYFLPFSEGNQIMVIIHTLAGLVMVIPFVWYLFRHWMIYMGQAMNHFMLSGYILMAISLLLCISGLILTWQALFSYRINPLWDRIHVITTFIFIGFAGLHVLQVLVRDYRLRSLLAIQPVILSQKKFLKSSSAIFATLIFSVFFWSLIYREIEWDNRFPSDYSLFLGPERPFAPSLAATSSGGAFDPRSLSGSEGCGTEGCHQEIYEEWEVSAHRYAAMDIGFQKIQEAMGKQNGPESTRYCAGCHDPISLFAGAKNIYTEEDDLTNLQGYQEGVSCIACHAITETDIKGNANYVIDQPGRYLYELEKTRAAKFISDFLIRAYPEYHTESLQHKLFKSPEFCAACHKQFIDEEVNNVGWVQLQNQYDKWKNSKWNHPGDPARTIECRECHMPLVENSLEPGSGDDMDYNRTPDDGKHRSHRFLGANQLMPAILDLHGAEKQIELTEQWLRGEFEIPEIADKWVTGPAVPIELIVPEQASPGEEITIQAVLTNHKPGHDFPTGPIDIIQGWLEIVVTDERGNEIFSSGKVDSLHFIEPGSFIFKVEPVDQYGNLIDKHNLWEMVGVRYNRSMFPGFSDQAYYTFSCPGNVNDPATVEDKKKAISFRVPGEPAGNLTVRARLNYRKMDQFLVNFLFGPETGLTTPVTIMSEDKKSIKINL